MHKLNMLEFMKKYFISVEKLLVDNKRLFTNCFSLNSYCNTNFNLLIKWIVLSPI